MAGLKSAVSSLAKSVFETSQGVVSTAKFTLAKTNEEEKIKSVYIEIGKKVHEIYSYGGELGSFFDEKYKEIIEHENRIREINEQIEQAKKSKTIYASDRLEAKEQPAAGSNEVIDAAAVQIEPVNEISQTKKVCGICMAENDMGDKFCLQCGRLL